MANDEDNSRSYNAVLTGTARGYDYYITAAPDHQPVCGWNELRRRPSIPMEAREAQPEHSLSAFLETVYHQYDIVNILYNEGLDSPWQTGKGLLLELRQHPTDFDRTYAVFTWLYENEGRGEKKWVVTNHVDVRRYELLREVVSSDE